MYDMKQVVVIDTGIDMKNCNLSKHVIGGTEFRCLNDQILEDHLYQDDNGHGTMCADTILQVYDEALFYVIKIANSEGKTSTSLLRKALFKCLSLNIKYICISLAVTAAAYQQELFDITKRLVDQNKLIFVSIKNNSQSSYPANLPTVIGVAGQPFLSNELFSFSARKEIQAIFDDSPLFVYTLANRFAFFKGTSKANALCVGMSLKLIHSVKGNYERMTFSEFNRWFEDYSLRHQEDRPHVPIISNGDTHYNLLEVFGGKIKKAISKTTNHHIDLDSIHDGPFISRLTGINFNNFYDFWLHLENELNFSLTDHHRINIQNVCSLPALLNFLQEVVDCRNVCKIANHTKVQN